MLIHTRRTSTGQGGRLAAVVLGILASGCLLDRSGIGPSTACNFDLEAASICAGSSRYRVTGLCGGGELLKGYYWFEGQLAYDASDGTASEIYQIEPVPFSAAELGPGEATLKVQCDRDPFLFGGSPCSNKVFDSSYETLPAVLSAVLLAAEPVAQNQFSEAQLAPFDLAAGCGDAPPPPPEQVSFEQNPALPADVPIECPEERLPSLLVSSPAPNELFNAATQSSFPLRVEPVRQPPAVVEIEWQKLDDRNYLDLQGLPNSVRWSDLPLPIELLDTGVGAGEAHYRVRVRPQHRACDLLWSYWQEFRVSGGQLALRQP